jgi:hypothetical protein
LNVPGLYLLGGQIRTEDVSRLAEAVRNLSNEHADAFATTIQYTFRLLMVEGLESSELPKIDEQWETTVSGILASSPRARTTLKRYLA